NHSMTSADREIVRALKKGELGAFKKLYDLHEAALFRLAMQILDNRADAEDALQNAFLNVFRKVSEFKGSASLSTWLYRIVVNACLKIREKRPAMERIDRVPEPPAASAQKDPAVLEAHEALKRALPDLPLQQRMVFTLAEVEGFEMNRISEILNIQPSTARFHLFKAKERLRERLRPYLTDETFTSRDEP
ncbi:MAG: sigma-70 family RNA polymerase sigma factor, partial [Planctomycetes bacterium]|nr:sigma-70 family RNA polymerase sigma factor [Planctomycetota bacterium]